jgi:hypothetical protein
VKNAAFTASVTSHDGFHEGAVVLITLNHPREKFWGAIIAVSPAGVSVRGIDLNSFDDFGRQVTSGEPVAPHVVFFPMHRVERMELDVRNGEIPSMAERFEAKTGRNCGELFSGSFEASPSRD